MSGLIRFTVKLFWLLVTVVVLYVVAYFTNMLPDQLMPAKLFGKSYTDFKADIAKDAKAHDSTSAWSQKVVDALDNADNPPPPEAAATPPPQTPASAAAAANKPPMQKAQESVQQYNDSIKKEQDELNKI